MKVKIKKKASLWGNFFTPVWPYPHHPDVPIKCCAKVATSVMGFVFSKNKCFAGSMVHVMAFKDRAPNDKGLFFEKSMAKCVGYFWSNMRGFLGTCYGLFLENRATSHVQMRAQGVEQTPLPGLCFGQGGGCGVKGCVCQDGVCSHDRLCGLCAPCSVGCRGHRPDCAQPGEGGCIANPIYPKTCGIPRQNHWRRSRH